MRPRPVLRHNAGERFFANRTEVFDNTSVKGSEFLRQMKVVARRKKLTFRWVPERGSGSHGALVKDLKKERGPVCSRIW